MSTFTDLMSHVDTPDRFVVAMIAVVLIWLLFERCRT